MGGDAADCDGGKEGTPPAPAAHPPYAGARVCVIAVHGGGRDRRAFLRHTGAIFHPAGLDALLFDCSGHGLSDERPRWPRSSWPGRALSWGTREHADVAGAVAWARGAGGYNAVVVIATSQGAASTIIAAARAAGAGLAGPPPGPLAVALARWRRRRQAVAAAKAAAAAGRGADESEGGGSSGEGFSSDSSSSGPVAGDARGALTAAAAAAVSDDKAVRAPQAPFADALILENPFSNQEGLVRGVANGVFSKLFVWPVLGPRWLALRNVWVRLAVALSLWRTGNGVRRRLRPLDLVAAVPVPMLFLHGTADTLVPHSHSLELVEAARGGGVGGGSGSSVMEAAGGGSDDADEEVQAVGGPRLWLAEGAGHTLLFDVYPAEYGRRVLGFLGDVLPPAAVTGVKGGGGETVKC